MEKKQKKPLILQDNYPVRTLEELQQYFDLEKIRYYFQNGQLANWLQERYYETHYFQITKLNIDEADLDTKLCSIFDIDFQNNQETITPNLEHNSLDDSVHIIEQTTGPDTAEISKSNSHKKIGDKIKGLSPTPLIEAEHKNRKNDNLIAEENHAQLNKGNKLIWKILNLLISIFNWIMALLYIISSPLYFSTDILFGICFIIGGIIICPLGCSLIGRRKNWCYKKKFQFKLLQLGVSYALMTIAIIVFSILMTFSS